VSGRVTVELGRVIPGWDDDPGALFYLPRLGAVLATQCRSVTGWRCTVVARRQPCAGSAHIDVSYAEFAAAQTTVTVDPVSDAAGYAMIWQVRVRQQWTGGRLPVVAQGLAERLRAPHTVDIELDEAGRAFLLRTANIFPHALDNVLNRLVNARLLRHRPPMTYSLALPIDPSDTRTRRPRW
jgi:hypothetical protein